jgi:hypothetical protein
METTAIGLINQLGRTPWAGANGAADLIVPAARPVRADAEPVHADLEPARPGSTR